MFGWRRAARQDLTPALAKSTGSCAAEFVPIVTEDIQRAAAAHPSTAAAVIEIKLAGAVVRVDTTLNDPGPLTAVLRAVRASASRT